MNLLPGPGSHQSAAGGGGRPLTPEGERQVDVTPDLGAEGDLDVDRVARDVAALAKQHELTVVPAVPASTGDHLLVALSGVNVSAESFVQAAAGAGCRLLYARRHAFTVDQVAEFGALPSEPSEEETDIRRLRDSALAYEGRTSALAVAFVADGVLHRWTARAGWYERLGAAIRQAAVHGVSRTKTAERHANTGRSWSAEEEARLVERFNQSTDLRMLSEELGRSTGAIRARLRRLNLLVD